MVEELNCWKYFPAKKQFTSTININFELKFFNL